MSRNSSGGLRHLLGEFCAHYHGERFHQGLGGQLVTPPSAESNDIPLGAEHLRRTLDEYLVDYHQERHHQGLGNSLLEPAAANSNSGTGIVRRRGRIGGVLSYYYRQAA